MITTELAEEIAGRVAASGLSEALVSELRKAYPGIHFTYCLDDDIHGAAPFLERPGFNLYLVGGTGHCLSLSGNSATASGLVLAEVLEDD
jgi:hypothetical protein